MDERDIAAGVAGLYAEYPYPAHGVLGSITARMLRAPLAGRALGGLRYLDAGCGTGEQTLGVARAFGGLEVVGVDLNTASLAFAARLAARHGLSARFERRSLTEPLEGLGRFDLLSSIGVLHHLPEPGETLAHLRAVASPDAVFLGMVYGSFGKWELFAARDALSLVCGPDLPARERLALLAKSGLEVNTGPAHYARLLRSRLRFGPDLGPLEALRRVVQGRSASYQADGYAHAHELTFTWKELAALLERSGWRLLGWPRRSGMPDRPEQVLRGRALARLRALPLLEQASVYERIVKPGNLYFLAAPA